MHGAYTGARFSRLYPPQKHSLWELVSSKFSNLFSTPLRNTIFDASDAELVPKSWILGSPLDPTDPKTAPKTVGDHQKNVQDSFWCPEALW